jgi:predicted regulator of amino acid metabolism with ACT domain
VNTTPPRVRRRRAAEVPTLISPRTARLDVGFVVKRLAKLAGVPLSEVATVINHSEQTSHFWARGYRLIPLDKLAEAADALGFEVLVVLRRKPRRAAAPAARRLDAA